MECTPSGTLKESRDQQRVQDIEEQIPLACWAFTANYVELYSWDAEGQTVDENAILGGIALSISYTVLFLCTAIAFDYRAILI